MGFALNIGSLTLKSYRIDKIFRMREDVYAVTDVQLGLGLLGIVLGWCGLLAGLS